MIVIIDYGMGNTGSVKNALKFLGFDCLVSDKIKDIRGASHIILPGVGSFGDGMENIKKRGLAEILNTEVIINKKLFLGICLGTQLLADEGEEGGIHKGLGWVPGRAVKINPKGNRLPHIGWNDVLVKSPSELFENISSNVFYFVHSYYFKPNEDKWIVATSEYGEEFPVVIKKENIWGVQFHPEKSQKSGLTLLKNFLNLHA